MLEKRYFSIALYRAKALLKTESSRAYLRYLWWLADPLIELFLFYIIFGLLTQRGGQGFIAEILVGVGIVRFFMMGTIAAPYLLIHNEHILLTVNVPKYIFSLAHVLSCLVKYVFMLIFIFISLPLLGFSFQLSWLSVVPISFFYACFVLGITMLLSGITPFFPDTDMLYSKLAMVAYWASGIFFRPEDYVPQAYIHYFYWNPLALFVHAYRECLIYGRVELQQVLILGLMGGGSLAAGYSFISHFDKQYPRIIAQ